MKRSCHWKCRPAGFLLALSLGVLVCLLLPWKVRAGAAGWSNPPVRRAQRSLQSALPNCSSEQPLSVEALQILWKNPKQATQALLRQLSPREKLGQLMMLDFRVWGELGSEKFQPMTTLPSTVADLIHRYAIGSVILFRDNCQDIRQLHQLNRQLQESRRRLPLLIGIDQEGGIVQRLSMATQLPGNMALGATADPRWAQAAGEITGSELRALGFNINFAPVVDVNVNQNNPVIGVRAFSSQPGLTAKMAQAYIEGVQQTGLLATAKHFPGHGNTEVDSHTGLPIIPYSLKQWQTIDCLPFKQAMHPGVAAIMTAHVAVPALDNSRVISKQDGAEIVLPATLSRKIIQGQLRHSLGHEGLIFSDALNMQAITKHFGPLEAVKRALLAGIDIVIMPLSMRQPSDLAALEQLYQDLEKERVSNPLFKQRIDDAAQRVLFTKLNRRVSPQLPELTQALATVGSASHKTLAQTISRQAITLIKNSGVLPIDCRAQPRLLWISNAAASHAGVQQALQRINTQIAPAAISLQTALVNWSASGLPLGFEQQLAKVDKVIVMTTDLRSPSAVLQQLLDQAARQKKPLIVLAANNPYDVAYCEDAKVDAMLAIYGYKSFDPTDPSPLKQLTTNLEAGIATPFTDPQQPQRFNRPQGRLPVAIKAAVSGAGSYPVGHGLRYP